MHQTLSLPNIPLPFWIDVSLKIKVKGVLTENLQPRPLQRISKPSICLRFCQCYDKNQMLPFLGQLNKSSYFRRHPSESKIAQHTIFLNVQADFTSWMQNGLDE